MTPEERRDTMIDYLIMKVEEQDWHGVADAAMDLRELDREIQVRDEYDYPDSDSGDESDTED
jgi:hypothetical protein